LNSKSHGDPPIFERGGLSTNPHDAWRPAATVHVDTASLAEQSRPVPIYGAFYGLHEAPFDLTPNPKFLFLTQRQREALSNLRYGLESRKGLTLLLGDAGTGKTTILHAALSQLGREASCYVLVNNPTLQRAEFYELLAREFGLSAEARTSKARFLADLRQEAEGRFAAGGFTGIIVDEAQSLPDDLLEEIRLLGNIETPTTKLLNIVLSGQPELGDRLNKPSLRQLKQRVALRCELKPLSVDEAAAYMSGRLRIAGAKPAEVFTREAVMAIHRISGGTPRIINVLCDNALVSGFAMQVKPITLDVLEEVCRDFDLRIAPRIGAAPAPPPAETAVTPSRAPAEQPTSSSADTARVRPRRDSTTTSPPATAGSRPTAASDERPKRPEKPTTNERPLFSSFQGQRKSRFSFFD
jgi:general secretion pathway protein A